MKRDYYFAYLWNYLEEHGFDLAHIDVDFVRAKADGANKTYMDYIKSGYDGLQASELANQVLFTGVGATKEAIAEDYLEIEFDYRIKRLESAELSSLKEELAKDSFWSQFEFESGVGIDEEMVESQRSMVLQYIDQFLMSYGL